MVRLSWERTMDTYHAMPFRSNLSSRLLTLSIRQCVQDSQRPKTINVNGAVMTQYIHKGWSLRLSKEKSVCEEERSSQETIDQAGGGSRKSKLTATNVPGKNTALRTARDFIAEESRLVASEIFWVVMLSL